MAPSCDGRALGFNSHTTRRSIPPFSAAGLISFPPTPAPTRSTTRPRDSRLASTRLWLSLADRRPISRWRYRRSSDAFPAQRRPTFDRAWTHPAGKAAHPGKSPFTRNVFQQLILYSVSSDTGWRITTEHSEFLVHIFFM